MNAKLKPVAPLATRPISPLSSFFPDIGKSGRNLWAFDDFFGDFFGDLDHYRNEITFPKVNTKKNRKTGDVIIEIALAGYSKDDISVELTPESTLRVSHTKVAKVEDSDTTEDDWAYTYNGIAAREFDISWKLGPYQEVGDVTFKNGILSIMVMNTEPPKPETKLLKIK